MESIITAVIVGSFSLAGTLISNFSTHSKTMYRIEQLEKKQDIHNGVIERMYQAEKAIEVIEERQAVANHRIEDLEALSKK